LAGAPSWFPRDPMSLGIIAAGFLMFSMCLCAFCLVILILSRPTPSPATAGGDTRPTINPALIFTPIPSQTPVPPFNPSKVGTLLNPYAAAQLDGMTSISVDFYNPATGQFEPSGIQIGAGSDAMNAFVTALNIGQPIAAPDASCQTALRFNITRVDNSVVAIGVCLKDAVILRGGIPGLDGGDLPMGPYFIDVLRDYLPNLPDAFKQLLGL